MNVVGPPPLNAVNHSSSYFCGVAFRRSRLELGVAPVSDRISTLIILIANALFSCAQTTSGSSSDAGQDIVSVVDRPPSVDTSTVASCLNAPSFVPGMTVTGDTCTFENTPESPCYHVCADDRGPVTCTERASRAFYRIEVPPLGRYELTIRPRLYLNLLDECQVSDLHDCLGLEFAPSDTFPDLTYTYLIRNDGTTPRDYWIVFQGGRPCGPYRVSLAQVR